ncbi:MAG TPA: arginase family protein [Thermoleophilia bacterium]|nr:arginase family protein [Thermoleophilia bacterium]
MRLCTVIDAPSDLGLRPTGVDGLPDALRAAGLLEGLPGPRSTIAVPAAPYSPARDPVTGVLNPDGIAAFSRRLAERIAATLDRRRFPLVLGGDCSILLGATLALRRRGHFGLVFIDGHADFYTPDNEEFGEVASMDLAIVTGHGPPALTDLDGLRPLVRETDVAVLGVRDVDEELADGALDVRQTGVHLTELTELRRLGAVGAARRGLAALQSRGVEGFWIHVDADVLNDDVMPAVDYRMPDGLWPDELSDLLRVLLESPLAVGLEVTIYNPSFDDEERSAARVLATTLARAFDSRL